MTGYVEKTAEQKAYSVLLVKKRDEITEAARGFVGTATNCSYHFNLCRSYAFQPEELFMADHDMLALAFLLTEHDREVLAEVARAARVASDSLDKDDFESPAGFRLSITDFHHYYAMISEMVERALKPVDRREIDSAQFDLWRQYGEWYAHSGAGTE